ncbi:MAG TPA: hypothetical protein VF618_22720 [Thermoanaerobaculia bacterium]
MIETSLHTSEPVALPDRSSGQVARSVIGHAVLAAMMIVALQVFLPAVLLHCGLRNGRRSAWTAFAGAVLLVALFLGISAQAPGTTAAELRSAFASVAGVLLGLAVPALTVLPMVIRAEPFGRVVGAMVLRSIGLLAAGELAFRAFGISLYSEAVRQWQTVAAGWVEQYREAKMPADVIRFAEWIGSQSYLVVSSALVGFALFVILSLLMLGRLRAWREHSAQQPGGGTFGVYLFRNFALPDWLLFAFLFGGLTPLVHGLLQKVTANVLVVVAVLYLLQGLAIFRSLLVAMGAGLFGSLLAWMLLVFLTGGIGMGLLGVAGLFDSFFDFRHFKKRKDDSHEGHSD